MKFSLRWAHYGLTAAGTLALGYCLAVYLDARLFQAAKARQFESQIRAARPAAPLPSRTATGRVAVREGAIIGRLEVRRLGLSVMVVEGVEAGDLKRAAGHIPGTALPGEPGNVAIAAHRDTFFRPLRRIQPNDLITLNTLGGEYHYRVVGTEVVPPKDVSVLYPTGYDSLTLVTCFPFAYVGPAPRRFIVRAERMQGT